MAQVNPDLPWARPFTGPGFFCPHPAETVADYITRGGVLRETPKS
jgi:hypothetical protein